MYALAPRTWYMPAQRRLRWQQAPFSRRQQAASQPSRQSPSQSASHPARQRAVSPPSQALGDQSRRAHPQTPPSFF